MKKKMTTTQKIREYIFQLNQDLARKVDELSQLREVLNGQLSLLAKAMEKEGFSKEAIESELGLSKIIYPDFTHKNHEDKNKEN